MCGSESTPGSRIRPRMCSARPPPEVAQSHTVAETTRGPYCCEWYFRRVSSRAGVSERSASGERRVPAIRSAKQRSDAAAMPKQRPLPYSKGSNRRRSSLPPARVGTSPIGFRKPKPSRAGSKRRILDVDRVPVHGQSRLAHDLSEARVGVDSHPYLLRRPLDQLGEHALGYKVRDLRAYHVHPQDQVRLRVGDDLHEAVGLALDQGLAYGPEREIRLLDLVALGLGLFAA